MKFRDISLRGAWTTGGLEFNFGDIGHATTASVPVDYFTRTNPDGSVSCFIGATEWASQDYMAGGDKAGSRQGILYNPFMVV